MNKSILDVFKTVLEILEENQIPYMVVGSVASIIYGEPRLTKDMDLVVELRPSLVPRFEKIFPEERFYVPPLEILADEVQRRGQFNLIEIESGIKVDIVVRKDTPHGELEFARRRKTDFLPDFAAFVASPEDVILKKLDYFREGGSQKHIDDIRGILANTSVDEKYLKDWVEKLGLESEWKKTGE